MTISPRLLAALGARTPLTDSSGRVAIDVDDADKRYRDAIKAGAEPVAPPVTEADGARVARLRDRESGADILIRSRA